MLPPIFGLLNAAAPVTAIVGKATQTTAARIYRPGSVPAGLVQPYVVWSIISGVPENNLSDLPPSDRVTLQVDCYSPSEGGIVALATAVRNAIEPAAHMTGIPVDMRETEEPKLFRIALQFDYHLAR